MFISSKILDFFGISQVAFADLREQNASLRTERDCLLRENATLKVIGDYQRIKVNQLELERASLLEKAYGIRTPVPQVEHRPSPALDPLNVEHLFDDIGDELASKFGLPAYDK
jgi:hypothetical protein